MIESARGSEQTTSSMPTLVSSTASTRKWTIQGTSNTPYVVTAAFSSPVHNNILGIHQLSVRCTCPSGRQLARSSEVCKHACACLKTAIDFPADAIDAAMQIKQAKEAKMELAQVDALFPGERARIAQALEEMDITDLVERLQGMTESLAGIQALQVLLPKWEYPSETALDCVRCGKTYDPARNTVCELPHPEHEVERVHKDSKGARFECGRCEQSWTSTAYTYEEGVWDDCGACFR
jgi:hypothetical protein